jgi:hypothetical protein
LALSNAGIPLPPMAELLATFAKETIGGFCPAIAIALFADDSWQDGWDNVGALIDVATSWNLSLIETAELALPLAAAGVSLPPLHPFKNGISLNDAQLSLLSEDLDGKHPFLDELSTAHLLYAGKKLKKSMAEIAELVRPLTDFGVDIPKLDIFQNSTDLGDNQILLLSQRLNGHPPLAYWNYCGAYSLCVKATGQVIS